MRRTQGTETAADSAAAARAGTMRTVPCSVQGNPRPRGESAPAVAVGPAGQADDQQRAHDPTRTASPASRPGAPHRSSRSRRPAPGARFQWLRSCRSTPRQHQVERVGQRTEGRGQRRAAGQHDAFLVRLSEHQAPASQTTSSHADQPLRPPAVPGQRAEQRMAATRHPAQRGRHGLRRCGRCGAGAVRAAARDRSALAPWPMRRSTRMSAPPRLHAEVVVQMRRRLPLEPGEAERRVHRRAFAEARIGEAVEHQRSPQVEGSSTSTFTRVPANEAPSSGACSRPRRSVPPIARAVEHQRDAVAPGRVADAVEGGAGAVEVAADARAARLTRPAAAKPSSSRRSPPTSMRSSTSAARRAPPASTGPLMRARPAMKSPPHARAGEAHFARRIEAVVQAHVAADLDAVGEQAAAARGRARRRRQRQPRRVQVAADARLLQAHLAGHAAAGVQRQVLRDAAALGEQAGQLAVGKAERAGDARAVEQRRGVEHAAEEPQAGQHVAFAEVEPAFHPGAEQLDAAAVPALRRCPVPARPGRRRAPSRRRSASRGRAGRCARCRHGGRRAAGCARRAARARIAPAGGPAAVIRAGAVIGRRAWRGSRRPSPAPIGIDFVHVLSGA